MDKYATKYYDTYFYKYRKSIDAILDVNLSINHARGLEVPVKDEKPTKNAGTKREKFRSLAESRTNNALTAIGRIGNLSNRQLYEFDEAEVRKIVRALKDAINEVEGRFASPKGKAEARFKL